MRGSNTQLTRPPKGATRGWHIRQSASAMRPRLLSLCHRAKTTIAATCRGLQQQPHSRHPSTPLPLLPGTRITLQAYLPHYHLHQAPLLSLITRSLHQGNSAADKDQQHSGSNTTHDYTSAQATHQPSQQHPDTSHHPADATSAEASSSATGPGSVLSADSAPESAAGSPVQAALGQHGDATSAKQISQAQHAAEHSASEAAAKAAAGAAVGAAVGAGAGTLAGDPTTGAAAGAAVGAATPGVLGVAKQAAYQWLGVEPSGNGGPAASQLGEQDEEAQSGEKHHELIKHAWDTRQLGFGFSAGGFLFPYYVGIIDALQERGVLRERTRMAGASAGSLIVACYNAGLDMELVKGYMYEMAADCRNNGTRYRLGTVLRSFLERHLPDDAHVRCSGTTHVAMTRVLPYMWPVMVSEFTSREDLIAALLTSCHIPYYMDGRWVTTFRGGYYMDGGVSTFIPQPKPTAYTVKVCCFPTRHLATIQARAKNFTRMSALLDVDISPDTFSAWPREYGGWLGEISKWQEIVQWGLVPTSDDMLQFLMDRGYEDACRWAEAQRLVAGSAAAAAAAAGGGGSSSEEEGVVLGRGGRGVSVMGSRLVKAAQDAAAAVQVKPPVV